MNAILNFLFPPLCLSCEERCHTKILCPSCWLSCASPDPISRCRHCFEALEEDGFLCARCRQDRLLPIPRAFVFDPESPAHLLGLEAVEAMAGFAFLQWIQLEWPDPDAIIPMPDAIPIALAFSKLLGVPFIQALNFSCTYREGRLEEDQILLLFDVNSPLMDLQKAAHALKTSFPKKTYLLSLLPYADSVF